MRIIDAEQLDEKAVQFPNTSIWVPIEAVWNAPTIDAKPVRHQSWIVLMHDAGSDCDIYGCDKCRIETSIVKPTWTYCPTCGAIMDGENHDI